MEYKEPNYILQVHGEWSGIPEYDSMDYDIELDTWDEVREAMDKELPPGIYYILYDGDYNLLEEGTK